jgi:multiple sugar transport system substrate-binding protein
LSERHYLGLTWDHPRGFSALSAASRDFNLGSQGVSLEWAKQPLSGFEEHSIAELAERFDLLILDHPHIGEAVQRDVLVPLDELFSEEEIAAWEGAFIGGSFASYRYGAQQWALPIDAAAQVLAHRRDMIDGTDFTWERILELATRMPVALVMAGPHALLAFCSVCVALGEPPASLDPNEVISSGIGKSALEIIARLIHATPQFARGFDPIAALECLSKTDRLVMCPLIFGYVNYAAPMHQTLRPISFRNAPIIQGIGRHGSTLGGTGLAITRRCRPDQALRDHIRWLISADAQSRYIPAHDGQPSLRDAWQQAPLNVQRGRFYSNTAATLEHAWIRPRHAGYVPFQTAGSRLIRDGILDARRPEQMLSDLQDLYTMHRAPGAEL